MSKFDEAVASLDHKFEPSGTYVDDRPRAVSIVQSVRFPRDLNERLLEEAARRGVTPSHLIRDAVEILLDTADAGLDRDPVTELHTVVDAATRALRALERRHAA